MSFVPTLVAAASNSDYTKLQDGENRLRIVTEIVAGYEYWNTAGKPVRSAEHPGKPADCRPPSGDFDNSPKVFWSCGVYNYETKKVEVFTFTQAGIQNGLTKLANDPEWGNLANYGIKVSKDTVNGKTTYSVMPGKEAPLTADVQAAVDAKPLNIKAVLTNGNPFDNHPAPGTAAPAAKTAQQPVAAGDEDLPF